MAGNKILLEKELPGYSLSTMFSDTVFIRIVKSSIYSVTSCLYLVRFITDCRSRSDYIYLQAALGLQFSQGKHNVVYSNISIIERYNPK